MSNPTIAFSMAYMVITVFIICILCVIEYSGDGTRWIAWIILWPILLPIIVLIQATKGSFRIIRDIL